MSKSGSLVIYNNTEIHNQNEYEFKITTSDNIELLYNELSQYTPKAINSAEHKPNYDNIHIHLIYPINFTDVCFFQLIKSLSKIFPRVQLKHIFIGDIDEILLYVNSYIRSYFSTSISGSPIEFITSDITIPRISKTTRLIYRHTYTNRSNRITVALIAIGLYQLSFPYNIMGLYVLKNIYQSCSSPDVAFNAADYQ